MPATHIETLVQTTSAVIIDDISKDAGALSSFVQSEIARYADHAAKATARYQNGETDREMYEYAMNDIALSYKHLIAVVVGLGAVSAEKAWNKLAKAIWDGLGGMVGVDFPFGPPK